jgi:Leucine-rich repeat (LRR) protein
VCAESLHVCGLNLTNNNLQGLLPDSVGGSLTALTVLNLHGNVLFPPLPASVGGLRALTVLDLGANQMGSSALPDLSSLSALTYLDLSDNGFGNSDDTLSVPVWVPALTHLQWLSVANNQFITLPLPDRDGAHWDAMTSLLHADFTDLQLVNSSDVAVLWTIGTANGATPALTTLILTDIVDGVRAPAYDFPADGLQLQTALQVLRIDSNLWVGTWPTQLNALTALRVLVLQSNQFSGPLPTALPSQWRSSMRVIDLSDNQFAGAVPDDWGALSSLAMLDLSRNFLTALPTHVSSWQELRRFDASHNLLNETLSVEFSALPALTALALSGNALSGPFPEGLCHSVNLTSLALDANAFSGPVSNGLANCRALQQLDLSSNSFSGSLPDIFGQLTQLTELTLKDNDFVGCPLLYCCCARPSVFV